MIIKCYLIFCLGDKEGRSEKLIPAEARLSSENKVEEIYEGSFEFPLDFGEIGAVIVENHNDKEMFVKEVDFSGLAVSGSHTITCNSWIQPKNLIPDQRRVFFTNKVTQQTHYLPTNLISLKL